MARPKITPIRMDGPFLGLNTTHDVRGLGLSYAREAHNVILSKGMIQPRPPFKRLDLTESDENPIPGRPFITAMSVLNRLHGNFPEMSSYTVIVHAVQASALPMQSSHSLWGVVCRSHALPPAPGTTVHINQLAAWSLDIAGTVCMVPIPGNRLAVLANRESWVTDGTPAGTTFLGLPAPDASSFSIETITESVAHINASVSYQLSWYREDGAEGNATTVYSANLADGEAVRFRLGRLPSVNYGVNGWRIYRRNHTLNQVAWRRIGQVSSVDIGAEFVDLYAEDQIIHSSAETGPFGPSRNNAIGGARVGAWYKNRLFFSSPLDPSRLYYSGLNNPYGFHPDDYLAVSGDSSEQIGGLAEVDGQLLIGKPGGISILSGAIAGATNETAALGAVPPPSSHTLHQTTAQMGPENTYGGNGFVVAGRVPTVYFANKMGFYGYNGVVVRELSDLIQPTWRSFWNGANRCSGSPLPGFAVDARNGIVWIFNAMPTIGDVADGPEALAYHWTIDRGDGAGVWSTHSSDELPSPGPDASHEAIGALCFLPERNTLLIGGANGMIAEAAVEADGADVPHWIYRTGRLPLTKGRAQHVYRIEWYFGGGADVPAGSPLAAVGFQLGANDAMYLRAADLRQEEFIQRVGAKARDITLVAGRRPNWRVGWSPELGITGFAIDMADAGRN